MTNLSFGYAEREILTGQSRCILIYESEALCVEGFL